MEEPYAVHFYFPSAGFSAIVIIHSTSTHVINYITHCFALNSQLSYKEIFIKENCFMFIHIFDHFQWYSLCYVDLISILYNFFLLVRMTSFNISYSVRSAAHKFFQLLYAPQKSLLYLHHCRLPYWAWNSRLMFVYLFFFQFFKDISPLSSALNYL